MGMHGFLSSNGKAVPKISVQLCTLKIAYMKNFDINCA